MSDLVTWSELNIPWSGVDMAWEEVIVVIQVAASVGGTNWELPLSNTWREAKKQIPQEIQKKFLNIIVKVNDLTYKNSREIVKRKKINVNHIQKTFTKAGINLKVEVKDNSKKNVKIEILKNG